MRLLLMLLILPIIFGSDVIWNNGPTEFLRAIFKITELKNVDDLEAAISQSNSKWIRPKFMENWHSNSFLDKRQKKELTNIFQHSELAKEKLPKLTHYNAALIVGYVHERLQKRIKFLIKLHNQGITFDRIYLFSYNILNKDF